MTLTSEKGGWAIEILSYGGRWRRIGWPDGEADALRIFDQALRDYPTDYFIRLVRPDGSVQSRKPAMTHCDELA
jgi:hypothetical protein